MSDFTATLIFCTLGVIAYFLWYVGDALYKIRDGLKSLKIEVKK